MKKAIVIVMLIAFVLMFAGCSSYELCEYCFENDGTEEFKAGGDTIYACKECAEFYDLEWIYD